MTVEIAIKRQSKGFLLSVNSIFGARSRSRALVWYLYRIRKRYRVIEEVICESFRSIARFQSSGLPVNPIRKDDGS